jgi:hypothetical protein
MLKLAQGTKSGEYSSPKTVLGFCAIVLGIVATACVAATSVLAWHEATDQYALLPLGFFALFTVAMFAAVWWVLLKDPTKLQLGQMTGREFIDYQKLTLGDSTTGDQIVTLGSGVTVRAATDQLETEQKGGPNPPALPEGQGKELSE